MNILKAIEKMRLGKKITRKSNIGKCVGKNWLSLEREIIEEDNDVMVFDIIYFNVEAITKEHHWVAEYPATKNVWTPTQADLFAIDFIEVD